MRKFLTVMAVGSSLSLVPLSSALAQDAPALTLKRVLLSTGGVGYFEYEATVSGDAVLELPVRLDQVDDVIKSLVVYDNQGGIGEISLPGREPLSDVFRELPFPAEALSSPVALLDALRGAEVSVTGARDLTGRILSVTADVVQLPEGAGTTTRARVSLLTAEGVSQFILEEADSLTFTDAALQAQVGQALAALAEHGERDKRTLLLTSHGEGERTVRVAYVVEAPLWKTSYRLTLPADPLATLADLQGWAVLENRSGQDWEGVELTLVSGNPVTFRQALYNTYYVHRPEVPVEVLGRVLPPVDDEQVYAEKDNGVTGGEARANEPAPAPALSAAPYPEEAYESGSSTTEVDQAANITAAASSEATTQVIFTFPEPISVASGHSLLVPFISAQIEAERLSFYLPDTQPRHPLASVKLVNAGENGLPPGVLTLYEQEANGRIAFVGDARLNALPAGEERIISYAVDQKVTVTQNSTDVQNVTAVKIVNGTMILTSREIYKTTFEVTGAAREARAVLLQHPKWYGWELTSPALDAVEETPDFYRVTLGVAAGEVAPLNFTFERTLEDQIYLGNLDDYSLELYIDATYLSEDVKAQLVRILEMRQNLAIKRQELDLLQREVGEIVNEQGRIRQNLASVPENSDLHKRYLETLAQQEDRLAELNATIDTKQAEVRALESELGVFIASQNYN